MNINDWKNIIESFKELFEKESELRKNMPGSMNILSMFKLHDEISHSNVLAYLLNPKSNHKHGTEYLEKFLRNVFEESFDDVFQNKDLGTVEVSREKHRIDILIKHADFVIIIENKIYAEDQQDQLTGYYATVSNMKYRPDQIYVCYLTLQGTSPDSESFTSEGKAKMTKIQEDENHYKEISYGSNILSWLKTLTVLPLEYTLNNSLQTYIYGLEKLTHQNHEDSIMRKEKINILLDNFKTVEEYHEISESLRYANHLCHIKGIYECLLERKEEIDLRGEHEIYYAHHQQKCDDFSQLKESFFQDFYYISVVLKIKNNVGIIFEIDPKSSSNINPKGRFGLCTFGKGKSELSDKTMSIANNKENKYTLGKNDEWWYFDYKKGFWHHEYHHFHDRIASWFIELYKEIRDEFRD